MTTPIRFFKVGRPIDVLILNEFWNRVYKRALEEAADDDSVEYATGRMYHVNATVLNGLFIDPPRFHSHYPYDFYMRQVVAAAPGNEFQNSCYIPAGIYELRVVGRAHGSAGILEWFLNDVSIGTQDWYDAASSTDPVLKTLTGIEWQGGWVTVRGKTIGKNASSSSYNIDLSKYTLVRTGA